MSPAKLRVFALAWAGVAILLCSDGTAEPTDGPARFAEPVRIKTGSGFVGVGRYYPSPVFHDVDGDKLPDLVIADLFGRVTYARGTARKPGVILADETPLLDSSKKALKFSNW